MVGQKRHGNSWNGRDAPDGFTTLWEAGRLEMSVEAAALLPWHESLFTDDSVQSRGADCSSIDSISTPS